MGVVWSVVRICVTMSSPESLGIIMSVMSMWGW